MTAYVRLTTFAAVDPRTAFRVFTQDTASWWRREARFGPTGRAAAVLRFAGAAGGPVTEEGIDGSASEIGRILVWEPGARLVFEWHSRHVGAPELTKVDVRFVAKTGGTELTLEHRRSTEGFGSDAFRDSVALWWGDLLTAYRRHAAHTPGV